MLKCYFITFEQFLNKKPENKKLKKEIQNKNYKIYEEERQNNIKKCILKRKELIQENNNNNKNDIRKKIFEKGKKSLNISSENISYENKNKKYKINALKAKNGILVTDSTYVMKNYNGINTSVNKDDLNKVTCLNNEKLKLEKKMEENEQYLTNILKSEIIKENNIRKVQEKINKKIEKNDEIKEKGELIEEETKEFEEIKDPNKNEIKEEKEELDKIEEKEITEEEKLEKKEENIIGHEEKKEIEENFKNKFFDINEEEITKKLSDMKTNTILLMENFLKTISTKYQIFSELMIEWYKKQNQQISKILSENSKNGVELTFEEFYDIMTKKSFP